MPATRAVSTDSTFVSTGALVIGRGHSTTSVSLLQAHQSGEQHVVAPFAQRAAGTEERVVILENLISISLLLAVTNNK
jgi:hypothetical protein